MGGTLLLVLFIILFIVLLPLLALVDLLRHQFPDNGKLIWVLHPFPSHSRVHSSF